MGDSPKRTVQLGYDAMAERFLAWGVRVQDDPRQYAFLVGMDPSGSKGPHD